jgi:hypothetical protein
MNNVQGAALIESGELGSRFEAGAAPATVVELHPDEMPLGFMAREGVGRSERTVPEPGNQP